MPGSSPLRALGLILIPWLVAAEFPAPGDFFRQGRQHSDIYSTLDKPLPFDESQPLEARVRSYLDGHCSACHQPGGVLGGSLDLRFGTPLARTGLLALSGRRGPEGFLPRVRPGRPGESDLYRRLGSTGSDAMPPLGRISPDERGLALIRAWIEGLSVGPPTLSPTPSSLPAASRDLPEAEPSRLQPARTLIHRENCAESGLLIPRAEGDPDSPPAVRICAGGRPCRQLASVAARADGAKYGWIVRPFASLPRGCYRLILHWPGETGRRNLLVL